MTTPYPRKLAGRAEKHGSFADARGRSKILPGALVIAGDADAPAMAEVIDIVDEPVGRIVHLRVLSD